MFVRIGKTLERRVDAEAFANSLEKAGNKVRILRVKDGFRVEVDIVPVSKTQ